MGAWEGKEGGWEHGKGRRVGGSMGGEEGGAGVGRRVVVGGMWVVAIILCWFKSSITMNGDNIIVRVRRIKLIIPSPYTLEYLSPPASVDGGVELIAVAGITVAHSHLHNSCTSNTCTVM